MNKFLLGLFVCVLFANLAYSLDKNKHCKCRIRTDTKIVGGKLAGKTDFPWMVSLSKRGLSNYKISNDSKISTHDCGGIIVNERWILTAASCVYLPLRLYYAGFGNNNDLVKIYDAGRIPVENIVVHPQVKYDEEDKLVKNDIALIELETPIEFTDDVLPGCLDTNPYTAYDDVLIVGYGQTSKPEINQKTGETYEGELSRFLKQLDYKDISNQNEKCSRNKRIICANSNNEKESGCLADNGGPMHKTVNGRTTIVGVMAASDESVVKGDNQVFCNGPAYFTRIGNYSNWIEETIGGSNEHC